MSVEILPQSCVAVVAADVGTGSGALVANVPVVVGNTHAVVHNKVEGIVVEDRPDGKSAKDRHQNDADNDRTKDERGGDD